MLGFGVLQFCSFGEYRYIYYNDLAKSQKLTQLSQIQVIGANTVLIQSIAFVGKKIHRVFLRRQRILRRQPGQERVRRDDGGVDGDDARGAATSEGGYVGGTRRAPRGLASP